MSRRASTAFTLLALSLALPLLGADARRARAEAWVEKGLAVGDNSETEAECYRKALEIDPAYANAHFNLAYVLQTREDWEGALEHYQACLTDDPTRADAHFNLASALIHVRREVGYRPARVHLTQYIELEPKGGEAEQAARRIRELEKNISVMKAADFKDFYTQQDIINILARRVTRSQARGGQRLYEGPRLPLALFELGSHSLQTPKGQRQMKELAAALSEERLEGFRFVIEGHTDSQGLRGHNHLLGKRRAEAVRKYLAYAGLDAHRFSVLSYGEDEPAYPNDSKENRENNRRVEIVRSQSID